MSQRRKVIYNKALEPFSGVQTIEIIDTSSFENGHLFTVDILIHSSNGQNILENCSFIHFVCTYLKVDGTVTFKNRKELSKRIVLGGALATIDFIIGTDYDEVINGSNNIEIQIDGSSGYDSYITSYIEVDGVIA